MKINAPLMLLLSLGASLTAHGSHLFVRGVYAITIENGMPHLEENLRYSTTHELRYLEERDLSTAFPVLAEPALTNCRLTQVGHDERTLSYRLTCAANSDTSGQVVWRIEPRRVIGTLYVKLGGKNMTLYQRVTARLIP